MALKDSTFLGTESIGRLLLRLSWPAVVSTVINMLYNLVDRVYIGNGVGKEALAGLALTMPIMIIIAAFGMMPGAQERLFDALKKAAPHLKDYLSCALPTSNSDEQKKKKKKRDSLSAMWTVTKYQSLCN